MPCNFRGTASTVSAGRGPRDCAAPPHQGQARRPAILIRTEADMIVYEHTLSEFNEVELWYRFVNPAGGAHGRNSVPRVGWPA